MGDYEFLDQPEPAFECVGCGLPGLTLPLYAIHAYRCPGPIGSLVIAAAMCIASTPYARMPEQDKAHYDAVVWGTLTQRAWRPVVEPIKWGTVRPYAELDETKDRWLFL